MWQEVKRSWNVVQGELAAACGCVEAWPAQNGYAVREDCTATDSTWDINLNTSTPQCQTPP